MLSKSTKKLISQRWDQLFAEKVREVAIRLDITSTHLTIESLQFMISLSETKFSMMKDSKSRSQYLEDILKYGPASTNTVNSQNKTKARRESGFIIDRLSNYLKDNHDQTFSSIELADLLSIPQPTIRTYIRTLAKTDHNFKLIQGRPNFIRYFEK